MIFINDQPIMKSSTRHSRLHISTKRIFLATCSLSNCVFIFMYFWRAFAQLILYDRPLFCSFTYHLSEDTKIIRSVFIAIETNAFSFLLKRDGVINLLLTILHQKAFVYSTSPFFNHLLALKTWDIKSLRRPCLDCTRLRDLLQHPMLLILFLPIAQLSQRFPPFLLRPLSNSPWYCTFFIEALH